MNQPAQYHKKGYLHEEFRLFHLRDAGVEEMEHHYHEFDKIVLFLSGTASYIIEGRSYFLQPWDVLLVSHHLIHKPVIDPDAPYERVVIYLDPGFLRVQSSPDGDLSACFRLARKRQFALMRPDGAQQKVLEGLLSRLEGALEDEGFGGQLLARTCFLQLLVHLNRAMVRDRTDRDAGVSRLDPKVERTLSYINEHLADDLSVDTLARYSYTSKYHFMRRFKQCTGLCVHQYITQKRLLAAAQLLRSGASAQSACTRCGFQDYSAFQRAFRRQFGMTPRQLQND
ncbi:MAG: helix-turn-helix domain-containing protein [Oscillospiraceae bacterium]|nr:helix-turn-helix domain-containing protein [Oscillospiraceae bacterium]